ncbi:MAG: hypothetical protein ACNA8H_13120 [Anaerolineales bacterium]
MPAGVAAAHRADVDPFYQAGDEVAERQGSQKIPEDEHQNGDH